jgi:hypothetical protein
MEKSTNQVRLPYAIIALNATDPEADEKGWDSDYATSHLMSSIRDVINRHTRYKQLAENWRRLGWKIETGQDLLECYYSAIRVVRIPRKGQHMLVDKQVGKLYDEITMCCTSSSRAKQKAHELPNVDEFQHYLEFALDHFSQNIDVSFNFMEAGISLNPIPRGLKDNIRKLLIHARTSNNFATRADDVFKNLAAIVASCVLLDCARERRPGKF